MIIEGKYSLLEAIKPKISEKKYRELLREIEWKEHQKYLEQLKKEQQIDESV